MTVSFGLDIGGTKMEIIALDEADGRELASRRTATPLVYEDFLDTATSLINDMTNQVGKPSHIGVGIPGIVYADRTICDLANISFLKRDFILTLSERVGTKINVENDANCFALSESVDGAGQGCASVFGVIAGTGLGGGLVINGKLIRGAHSLAGEWGHLGMPFPKDKETEHLCGCGTKGCIEANLSGPHLIAEYNDLTGKSITNVKEITDAEASGDKQALAFMETFYDRFARALLAPFTLIDPDIVVVGGGLSKIAGIYTRVPEIFQIYAFKFDRKNPPRINLKPAKYGDSSGVRGAAWLWKSQP